MCAKRLYKSVLHVRVIGIALFMGGQICCWYYICVCGFFLCVFFMRCNKLLPYISIFIMLHKNLKRSNKQVSIKSWVFGVLQFSGCYATTTGSFMPDWKIHFLQDLIIDNFTRTTEIATTLKLLTHQQQSGIISD